MALKDKLDTILAQPSVSYSYRILTTKLNWPAGEPPFSTGYLNVTELVDGNIVRYAPATFDEDDWTDCTYLVNEYHYRQDLNNQCDVLSLTVPCTTRSRDLNKLFQAMRVIVVQERYWNELDDTGWFYRAFCISTGYTTQMKDAVQSWSVNALNVLMLTGLDIVGSSTGYQIYKPDQIMVGDYTTYYKLALVGIATDAYEFGIPVGPAGTMGAITANGANYKVPLTFTVFPPNMTESTFNPESIVGKKLICFGANGVQHSFTILDYIPAGGLELYEIDGTTVDTVLYFYIEGCQPNWAVTPAPQFFVSGLDGVTGDVPLLTGGEAVQGVFGEGIVRVGKEFCEATPEPDLNFESGLGLDEGEVPNIKGVVYRLIHKTLTDKNNYTISSDVITGLTTSATATGKFHIADASDLIDKFAYDGLSIIVEDGSQVIYHTTSITYNLDGSADINLTNTAAAIASGLPFTYGYANTARELFYQLLMESGLQTTESGKPFYIETVESPTLDNVEQDILSPPLQYKDSDKVKRLEIFEELRRNYSIPPQYLVGATADGNVYIKNIKQLMDTSTTPVANLPLVKYFNDVEIDRTDMNVYTKVIVTGQERQVTDITQDAITIVEDFATTPMYTLSGKHSRTDPPPSGDYYFNLDDLFNRSLKATLLVKKHRPWCWYYHAPKTVGSTGFRRVRELRDQWKNKILMTITFPTEQVVHSIDLDVTNTWGYDKTDYPGVNYNNGYNTVNGGGSSTHYDAHVDNQILAIEYYDNVNKEWAPLMDNIISGKKAPLMLNFTAENDFVGKVAVTTDKIRIRCLVPSVAECDTWDEDYYHAIIGVYLTQVMVWTSSEIKSIAEIGVTAPFTGTKWEAVKTRLRTRTYYVDNVAYWANKAATVAQLAKEWLYEVTRNLAPRSIVGLRPDIILGDTVRLLLPTGEVTCFSTQLSNWNYFGTFNDGVLYYTLTETKLELFSDVARTIKVDEGTISGDNITLTYGSCNVTYTDDEDGLITIPTYLVTSTEYMNGSPAKYTLVNYADPYFEE